MGWEDRPYYRDRPSSGGNPLLWLVMGSVPLFTAFRIHVRAHASLIVYLVFILLLGFGYDRGFTPKDRVTAAVIVFLIVLLHEFGHCFAARWVGGDAREILMHPLGGLAFPDPPRRPLPVFITVAGGPAVNVLICLVCGALMWWKVGWVPWNPFRFTPAYFELSEAWWWVIYYTLWVYQVSWQLLIFNLLPIYPLDGGQMVQAILWPRVGYYKSMVFSCTTGMVGSILGGMIAIAFGNVGLGILAIFGFMTCLNMRRQVMSAGPYAFSEEDNPVDYGASLRAGARAAAKRQSRLSKWSAARARKRAQEEQAEQAKIDEILAKVSAHGMHSLSWIEKRTLKKATERQKKRDLETGRLRRG